MQADTLLKQVSDLAEAYAKAQTCRALAHTADLTEERANLNARADYWDLQASELWAKLTAAMNSALPPTVYATADPRGPVRPTNGDEIEVRGSLDHGARAVSIRFTAAQAVPVGAALIACAAACTQHGGGRLAEILPPVPTVAPGLPGRPG